MKGRVISRLVLMVAMYITIAIILIFINQIKQYKQATDTYVMLQDSVFQNGIVDWEKLKGTETVAWIKFKNKPKSINYPVMQNKRNDFYLDHLYNKKKSISGSIFMDKNNNPILMDKNTIIYGHNMQDGSMFHDLRYFMDKNFWKDNREFYLYLPDGTRHTYEIFTVNQVYDIGYAYDTQFVSEQDFMENINNLYKSSMIGTSVKVTAQDKIVTLSTCMTNEQTSSDRLVVIGVERNCEQVQKPASWYTAPNDSIGKAADDITTQEPTDATKTNETMQTSEVNSTANTMSLQTNQGDNNTTVEKKTNIKKQKIKNKGHEN